MERKNSKLEVLEDSIFPVLLDAAENKSPLKDAAQRAGMPYTSFKQILKQIDLSHKNAATQKNREIINEIKRIAQEIMATIETISLKK